MTTTHNLIFEHGAWIMYDFDRFRVGTCEGLYRAEKDHYDILAITNNIPGNGHLNDVFEWFEHSCKRDKKSLRILEVWNSGFRNHLINKRGFKAIPDTDHLIKTFK